MLDEGAAPDQQLVRKKVISERKLAKFNEKHQRRGIVYMSRVPPHLKPLKLRQMLEVHAQIGRIYMAPKAQSPAKAKSHAKRDTGKQFSEAWIEFEDKCKGRAVVELLNGSPMGGKHRSKYHDDLWTLKYLPKFKWDHLTEEVAYQKAVREKKFAQELSVSKKERDFYLSKVAESKKVQAITERKRKRGDDMPSAAKQIRTFYQNQLKSAEDAAEQSLCEKILSRCS